MEKLAQVLGIEKAVEVAGQHARVVDELLERFPDAAVLLDDAREEILAFTAFPPEHWRQATSERTNPSQDAPSSLVATSTPRTSRWPSALTPTALERTPHPKVRRSRARRPHPRTRRGRQDTPGAALGHIAVRRRLTARMTRADHLFNDSTPPAWTTPPKPSTAASPPPTS
jgi:hypothetical protein